MSSPNDIVFDKITDSAKRRFDYASFAKVFTDMSKELRQFPENIVFMVIDRLAGGEKKEIICLEIQNHLFVAGLKMELKDITEFVSDKDKVFKTEIFAYRLAVTMLQDDGEPLAVLNSIMPLL